MKLRILNTRDDADEWNGYEGCLSELVQLPGKEIWEGPVRDDDHTIRYAIKTTFNNQTIHQIFKQCDIHEN